MFRNKNNMLKKSFKVTTWKRKLFFLMFDLLIVSFSLYSSFWLRFDGNIPYQYINNLPFYLIAAIIVKINLICLLGGYKFSWRFFSIIDLVKLFISVTLSTLVMAIIYVTFRRSTFIGNIPRSILLIDFIITFSMMFALRITKRIYIEYLSKRGKIEKGRARVLIIGAGEAGASIVNEMMKNPNSSYYPIGFVDDDKAKQGIKIFGVKVLGGREVISSLLKDNHIDEILIAIPSAKSREIKQLVNIIRNAGWRKKIRILPSILDLVTGHAELKDIKEIKIEDLLSREPVSTDFKKISEFIRGRRILVTGAAGSIGSELVRTILQFKPNKVLALDIDETDLFNLMNSLPERDCEVIPIVADIRDKKKLEKVFVTFEPKIIIHCAAYKHVPMLEIFPEEAIKTNVMGTKHLAELAIQYKVEKFVNISTDKAINPTSVMGASKRVCEEMLKIFNSNNSTKFISVRFGNVLGSRGSVIPIFEEQIKKGGPVTVTHPEMKRYFMAISEAVILVLQAAASGEGGEVFILDMGDPVKIIDLAKEMIRLSGFEPDVDIKIEFIGLRPGEKLFEELLSAEEGSEPTDHPKIFKARAINGSTRIIGKDDSWVMEKINLLIQESIQNNSTDYIIEILKDILPTYRSYQSS